MNNSKQNRYLAIIMAVILIISLTACGQIFKRPKEKKQDTKKNPPKVLTSMEKDTEKIVMEIQKVKDLKAQQERQKPEQQPKNQQPQDEKNKQDEKTKKQEKDKDKQGDKSKEKSKDKEQQKPQQQNKQNQQSKEKKQAVKWPDLEKTVKSLHTSWNQYQVQAKKDGADSKYIEEFSKQLNTLTEHVLAHKEEDTLAAANQLYQYYPKFLNLYKHKAPPETKEMKFYVQKIVILIQEKKWDEAAPIIDDIKNSWQTAKARLEKPDKNLNHQIDAAINDLSNSLKMKNIEITKLKATILVKNIDKVK